MRDPRSSHGLSPEGVARFAAMLRRHVGPTDPGAVALLARGDEVHVELVGARDLATGAPMQRDTQFRIASMGKPITAFAALALVERGVLALDAPVDRWLPELANRRVLRTGVDGALDDTVPAARPITLRDLLSLQLGIGAIMARPGTYPIQRALADAHIDAGFHRIEVSPDAYLARLGALPLVHQPGAGWLYHMGLEIAGVLLARAAQRPFPVGLAEHGLGPLGMRDTGFHTATPDRLATQYGRQADGAPFTPVVDASAELFSRPPMFPAGGGQGGGLVSTADDYLAFARRLLAGGTIVDQMARDQATPAIKAAYPFFPGFWEHTGWGLGLSIHTTPEPYAPTPGRIGWDGGYGTSFFVDPHTQLIAILLTQRAMMSPVPDALMTDFVDHAFGALG